MTGPRLVELDREKRCVLEETGPCSGRLDRHHLVEQAQLRRKFRHGAVRHPERKEWVPLGRGALVSAEVTLDDLLSHPANIVSLCRRHHDLVSWRRVYLVPDGLVWEFANETGLAAVLERALERAA